MEIKPKYYLKRKLKNGDIALIPVVADPPLTKEDINPAGLEKYKQLKEQYSLKEMARQEKRKGYEKQRLEAKLWKAKTRTRQWALGVEVEWPRDGEWEKEQERTDKENRAKKRAGDKKT